MTKPFLQSFISNDGTGRSVIVGITKTIFLVMVVVLAPLYSLADTPFGTLDRPDSTFRFEMPLAAAANDLADDIPVIKSELQALFGWTLPQRPTIVLIQTRETFRQLARHSLIAAYAVPSDNLIVIDYGRLNQHPLRGIRLLKHEMVHLYLHAHITGNRIPKWLDEGVAQWASDGVADLLEEPRPAMLTEAVLSGSIIPLAILADDFPSDDQALLLAYAQSRSVVSYIADTFGADKIVKILGHLKEGSGIEESVRRSLSISMQDLEKQWISSQERPAAFLALLAGYLYEILFLAAALLTVVGFIRFRIKKYRYRDEEDDF